MPCYIMETAQTRAQRSRAISCKLYLTLWPEEQMTAPHKDNTRLRAVIHWDPTKQKQEEMRM